MCEPDTRTPSLYTNHLERELTARQFTINAQAARIEKLEAALAHFADQEVCPVNEQCVPGFVAGAYWGWGQARCRVAKILNDIRRQAT